MDCREISLADVPGVSVRLGHILQYGGFKTLGDLHGLAFSGFRHRRNCGAKTVRELEALVHGLRARGAERRSRRSRRFLCVPPSARGLAPGELPLSVRAEKALRNLGIQRLGELEGVDRSQLLGLKGCGVSTAQEIEGLAGRARAGEFDVSPIALKKLAPVHLLRRLDELLGELSGRDREIICRRLGSSARPAPTLLALGTGFQITRERVRQIADKIPLDLVRQGGPQIRALLSRVGGGGGGRTRRLTPALVAKWAPGPWSFRHKPEFYIRLIGRMAAHLPRSRERVKGRG